MAPYAYFAKEAWQYVALIFLLLANQLPEPVPSSPLGKVVRDSQWAIGLVVGLSFLVIAVVLSKRAASGNDKGDAAHDAMVKKALQMAGPDGEITAAWYAGVTAGVHKLYMTLAVGAVALVGYMLYSSYPHTLWQQLGLWLEGLWHYLLKTYTHKQLVINGLMIAHLTAHWGLGLIYLAADILRPKWLLPYKIQPEYQLTKHDLGRAAAVALMNQAILYACCVVIWEIWEFVSPDAFDPKLPGLIPLGVSIFTFLPFTDFFFFWPHWMFHKSQWCYDHIHYMHHSWMAPISITCIYAHPIEFLFGNVTIVLFGPYVFGSHMVTWWAWTFLSTVGTSIAHSGWRMPVAIFGNNMSHDYHHSNIPGPEGPQNIGNSGVTDSFMNTNTYYETRTWNHKVDAYPSIDFPLAKILAQAGELPGMPSAVDAEADSGVDAPDAEATV